MSGHKPWSPPTVTRTEKHCLLCGEPFDDIWNHICVGWPKPCPACGKPSLPGRFHACLNGTAAAPRLPPEAEAQWHVPVETPLIARTIQERLTDIEQRGERIESMLTRLCEVFLED